jgi:hypothetical protein
MTAYTIRDIDEDLWKAAHARAAEDGRTMKATLMRLLRLYARVGLAPLEAAALQALAAPRLAPRPTDVEARL